MNNSPEQLLARHNPMAGLDEWDPAARQDVLDAILSTEPSPKRRPRRLRITDHRQRRWALAAGLTAAAAAIFVSVALPAGTPGGPQPATAAALRHLAVVASIGGPTVGPGQYGHIVSVGVQPPGPNETSQFWAAPDGNAWFTPGIDGGACLQSSPYPGDADEGAYQQLPAAALARLPVDVPGLARFIDTHPSGDNRGATNRFTVVRDLLSSSLAPARLRSAAIGVLADTPGLKVDRSAQDELGRSAVRIYQVAGQWTEALFFDPSTAQILQEDGLKDGAVAWRTVIRTIEPVDRLPDLPTCTL